MNPKLVIILEGGLVQDVLTTYDVRATCAVIDLDTDGACREDLTRVPMEDGPTDAHVCVFDTTANTALVESIFAAVAK